jgi:hypothetical protein
MPAAALVSTARCRWVKYLYSARTECLTRQLYAEHCCRKWLKHQHELTRAGGG